jgi:hypothetical protein
MTFYDDRPGRFLDVVRHEVLDGTPTASHHGQERPGRPVDGR